MTHLGRGPLLSNLYETSFPAPLRVFVKRVGCFVLGLGGGNETARVHQTSCWVRSLVAAYRRRAATRPPDDWISEYRLSARLRAAHGRIQRRPTDAGPRSRPPRLD